MTQDLTHWNGINLDKMRELTDPPADEAAKALFEANDKKAVGRFLNQMVRNDFIEPFKPHEYEADIPRELLDYFNNEEHFAFTPEETAIIDKGCDIFALYGPEITMALGVRSLLKQYAHTKAIQVLRMTTLLDEHTDRRVIETMQFLMDVMTPGWYKPDGYGIRSIQKLRLVHAMVRFRIWNNMQDAELGPWDDDWGQPINQEDMIFANQTFSVEVIKGLETIGMPLSPEEREAFFQTWVLIGRALGVHSELEPVSYEEGVKLQNQIYQRHFTLPNAYGPELSDALIKWLSEVIPFVHEDTIITLVKYFNGPENYEVLEQNLQIDLSKAHDDLEEHLRKDLGFVDEAIEASESHKGLLLTKLEKFNRTFLSKLVHYERGGKQAHFRIADGFQLSWELNRYLDRLEKPKGCFAQIMRVADWVYDLFTKSK